LPIDRREREAHRPGSAAEGIVRGVSPAALNCPALARHTLTRELQRRGG
jgi:hypothetical protein